MSNKFQMNNLDGAPKKFMILKKPVNWKINIWQGTCDTKYA